MLVSVTPSLIFVGEEQISVGAGDFQAYHFQFVSVEGFPDEHPVYDVWTSADGDYLFLKGEVGGYMPPRYALMELREAF